MYRNDCHKPFNGLEQFFSQILSFQDNKRQPLQYPQPNLYPLNTNNPNNSQNRKIDQDNHFTNSPQLLNAALGLLNHPSSDKSSQNNNAFNFYNPINNQYQPKEQKHYQQHNRSIEQINLDQSKQKHSQKYCDYCHKKDDKFVHTSDNLVLCQKCYIERKLQKERKKNQQRKYHQENNEKDKKEEDRKNIPQIKKSQKKQSIPTALICAISQDLMSNPVIITVCGHTFDEKNIREWFKRQKICPVCKKKASQADLQKNYALADMIESYKKEKAK